MQSSGISSPATAATQPGVTPPRNRHALFGRSVAIDPRIDAARADLTDVRLAHRVFAPHYAAAMPTTALAISPIRSAPACDAPVRSELLPGDAFEMLELSEGFAWGISTTDGVVGYVTAADLGDFAAPTHRVIARTAALREAPDSNASSLATLPMGARIAALGERDRFLLTDHGYVAIADVEAVDVRRPERLLATVRALAGVPAREGGRSGAGVDAAGLIFLALDTCGIAVPRFGDLQCADVGVPVESGAAFAAGDLLFFDAHAAIAESADRAMHVDMRVQSAAIAGLLADSRFGPLRARRRVA